MSLEGTLCTSDTPQITDLIKNIPERHTMTRPYVYFVEGADGIIKIGYSLSLAALRTRMAHYELSGGSLLAALPGRKIEETELKYAFKADLARGDEWFYPVDRLLEYIEALLVREFAAPYLDQVEYLGNHPYETWRPDAPAVTFGPTEQTGQATLFREVPLTRRERVEIARKNFNAMSLTDDWFTPPEWVDPAREVMGDIDLDPASHAQANDECVKAAHWYSKEQNGLDRSLPWFGRMWINPPYGTGAESQKMFMARLRQEISAGNVQQAVTCLNLGAMATQWFRREMGPIATAHCVPFERISFIPPRGVKRNKWSPLNGTVFSYTGPHTAKFIEVYRPLGHVLLIPD